ncbi:MAG: YggS family pyridoxal phosphate-dependent enzyme [Clostridia bacterium]|nr:YggS family pyridoxal phosphate-dependent enzyme [Clostridia bacterium]
MMEKLSVEERFSNIDYNLDVINERIENAAVKSGRKPEDISFMAVTKTVEPIFINRAIEHGVKLIGENKVQEFLSKKEYLKLEDCEAHLIGHLQTNKVRQIVGEVSMIQSVDSIRLAKEISKRSEMKGITTDCLIEVNIGDEENKTGLDLSLLSEMVHEVASLPNISVKGMMTVPPFSYDLAETRKYFLKMHQIFIDIKAKKIDNINMCILSMGMSSDYEEAILCGSNFVRVGSAIFGPRIY